MKIHLILNLIYISLQKHQLPENFLPLLIFLEHVDYDMTSQQATSRVCFDLENFFIRRKRKKKRIIKTCSCNLCFYFFSYIFAKISFRFYLFVYFNMLYSMKFDSPHEIRHFDVILNKHTSYSFFFLTTLFKNFPTTHVKN